MKNKHTSLPEVLKYLIISLFVIEIFLLSIPQHARINHQKNVEHFQNVLYQKKKMANEWMLYVQRMLEKNGKSAFHSYSTDKEFAPYVQQQIHLAILQDDSLIYWTNADFISNNFTSSSLKGNSIFFINSTWFYTLSTILNEYKIFTFIPIKKEYSFENKYLKNFYYRGFDVNYQYNFSLLPQTLSYYMLDDDGEFLCSVIPVTPIPSWWKSCVFLFVLVLLFISVQLFCVLLRKKSYHRAMTMMLTALIVLRIVMQVFHIPAVVYQLPVFNAEIYASSNLFPSLGDTFFTCWLLLLILEWVITVGYKLIFRTKYFFYGCCILCLGFIYLWFYLWDSFVFQSNISFELYKLNSFFTPSLLAILITSMLAWAVVRLLWFIIRIEQKINLPLLEKILISAVFIFFLFFLYMQIPFHYSHILFLLFFIALFFIVPVIKKIRLWFILGSIFLFSTVIVLYTFHLNEKKTKNLMQVVAVSLSNEHDIVAQLLMSDIEKKLVQDRVLQGMMQKAYNNRYEIYQYLKGNYFYGFWERYDLQVTICSDVDQLKIMPNNESCSCFNYFSKLILNKGSRFNCQHFYSIDNDYGEISYLGVFSFPYSLLSNTGEKHIYLELNRKLLSQIPGYPDLLLDENTSKTLSSQWDNYAKYKSNRLIQKNGTCPYSYLYKFKKVSTGSQLWHSDNDYLHLIYSPAEKSYIVVSNVKTKWYQYVWVILYLFNLFTLIFAASYLLFYLFAGKKRILYGFRFKYISSFIGVLLSSYIIIGVYTFIFFNSQYRKKNEKVITEKMQTVVNSLYEQIGSWEKITNQSTEVLTRQLMQLSNIFYADINIFNPEGILLATSRPVLFDKGITGTVMNADAYHVIRQNHIESTIYKDKIGALTFMSSYSALYSNGHLKAIVQLPYFTEEEKLNAELSTVLFRLSNIYILFIILSFGIIILLANGILKPLTRIQHYLKRIRTQKKINPIIYKQNDEISGLVKEYNRVLEELADSTDKLLKTERESAWRDIARQIAHEIKNPLTPMKLNIQYLIRYKQEKGKIPDEQFDKTMLTLLEQIESLSSISSAFSNFANMPLPQIEEIEIIEILKPLVLFFSSQQASIELDTGNYRAIYINGDRDYIKRIFTNLLTNAIQSIPPEQTGKIKVQISISSFNVIVSVIDNGIGISNNIADNIFKPSFTTKSSGMGIGLTLVKNMTEAMGGSVHFKSKEMEGTTFFIELPYIRIII